MSLSAMISQYFTQPGAKNDGDARRVKGLLASAIPVPSEWGQARLPRARIESAEETLLGRRFRRLILSDLKKRHPVGPKVSNCQRQSSPKANKGKSHEKKSLLAVWLL
jgi:hypothetical protein